MRIRQGFTLIEWVMVLLLCSVLAMSFVALIIPQVNLFFYLPQQIRMQNFGNDLLGLLLEGDITVKGIRYAAPVEGPVLPSSSAIRYASATRLNYGMMTSAEGGSPFNVRAGNITYKPSEHRFVRQSPNYGDSWAEHPVPEYAGPGSGLLADPISGTNVFRYYDADHNPLSIADVSFNPGLIRFVEVAVRVYSGSGKVKESEGSLIVKSGVEIKHFTT